MLVGPGTLATGRLGRACLHFTMLSLLAVGGRLTTLTDMPGRRR